MTRVKPMRRFFPLAVLMCGCVATSASLNARQSAAPPMTWLSVSVIHDDGHLITDIGANELEIQDNGERREIGSFRSDPIPFSLAIMTDISSSMETNYSLVRQAVGVLTSQFKPGDRAIVGSFDALPWISEGFSARPDVINKMLGAALTGTARMGALGLCDGDWIDRTSMSMFKSLGGFGDTTEFTRRLAIHGGSAIWDGAACGVNAAASDAETPRRFLVLLTDGVDTMSYSTLVQVSDRAKRLGVMIYTVSLLGDYGIAGGDLKHLAEETGGGYFYLSDKNKILDAFTRIGEELHRQYVVGFSPTTPVNGPHDIKVVSRRPNTKVQFRKVSLDLPVGRAINAAVAGARAGAPVGANLPAAFTRASPAGAASSSAAPTKATRTRLWDSLDEFRSKSWSMGSAPRMSIDALRGMNSTLRGEANGWIKSVAGDEQTARRFAAAGFVLDLLDSQTDPFVWLDNQPVPDLVEWASRLLATGPPSPEERLWYFGISALCEREGAASLLDRVASRAQSRFPDEGRFILAQAIAEDLRTWPEERDVRAFDPPTSITGPLTTKYKNALALPDVRTEATVRLAFFELRRGRVDAALEDLKSIEPLETDDRVLRFWFHLVKGRAKEQNKQLEEAIASYRLALDAVPDATSARAALVTALIKNNQTADGARLAREQLTSPAATLDPWTIYLEPDMRYWKAIGDQLRKVVVK